MLQFLRRYLHGNKMFRQEFVFFFSHILCCQGGWQNMRRCPPLTDTDQFLAGSRCLFPNMMTDCFNFPRHMAAMHQSQQQMAIKHLSH